MVLNFLQKETIEYRDEVPESRSRLVRTVIMRANEHIPVDYHVDQKGARWLIRDVVIDGVSIVENYNITFTRVIQNGGMSALIDHLEVMLLPRFAGGFLLVATYLLGFLMVSTVPYNSFKDFEIVKSKPLPVLFTFIIVVTVVAISPGLILFLMLVAYLISGPVRYLVWHMRKPRKALPDVAPPGGGPAEEAASVQNSGKEPPRT